MKVRLFERDIFVLETIIQQLENCLMIFIETRKFTQVWDTKKDIQTCKKELKRLNVAKDAEKDAAKGAAKKCSGVKPNDHFMKK